jgi:hypothetical protein
VEAVISDLVLRTSELVDHAAMSSDWDCETGRFIGAGAGQLLWSIWCHM